MALFPRVWETSRCFLQASQALSFFLVFWHVVSCTVPISSGIKVSLLRTSVLWTESQFPEPNVVFWEGCFTPRQATLPSSSILQLQRGGIGSLRMRAGARRSRSVSRIHPSPPLLRSWDTDACRHPGARRGLNPTVAKKLLPGGLFSSSPRIGLGSY